MTTQITISETTQLIMKIIKAVLSHLLEFDNYICGLYKLSSKEINEISDNITYKIQNLKSIEISTYSNDNKRSS